MTKVFVTGAAGYIGGELTRNLIDRGDEVVALAHTPAAQRSLSALGIETVRGNILDSESLGRGMAGCDLVYHVAAVNSHCPKDPSYLMRVNIEGTENVVREAIGAGVGRVVYTSSSATVGEPEGTVGTEKTKHRGTYLSAYEESKHKAERVAVDMAAQAELDFIALNPSSVQGPPRKAGTGALIIAFLNGKLPVFVDTYVSVVDVRDVVEAHLLAAGSGRSGSRYLLNSASIPSRDLIEMVIGIAGVESRVVMVPRSMARGVASTSERAMRLVGKSSPLCRARIDTILHGHRYDGSQAARELGFRYRPIEETFTDIARWAVREGLVSRNLPGLSH